jgi:hypothetical protein
MAYSQDATEATKVQDDAKNHRFAGSWSGLSYLLPKSPCANPLHQPEA